MNIKSIFVSLGLTLVVFLILGYCLKHSENSGLSSDGIKTDLNFQWSHVKVLELKVDSLKMVIIKMNSNQNILNNQFLQHVSTQTQLNKEMFRNAEMQLQMNDILSKRINSR